MKTEGVRSLVLSALEAIPQPYSHNIIDEVFSVIEQEKELLAEYERLCEVLGRVVVNTWSARWVGLILGKVGEKQVPSKLSNLIGSYSILDTDHVSPLTESEALKSMSDYYLANRSSFPKDIRHHRERIVALILGGLSAADAFALVLEKE